MMPKGVRQTKGQIYAGDIPFTKTGDLLHFADPFYDRHRHITWKPNFKFHGTLMFKYFNRGRSAAYAEFSRMEFGVPRGTVIVFLKDLADMIAHPGWKEGFIKAEFTFCKRGQNYGCKVVS